MCQATDSADSSKGKCFLCSTHEHICDHTTSLDCSEFPVFCFSKPNHSADGQTNETGQWQHLPLKVLLELEAQWPCLERQCAGRGIAATTRGFLESSGKSWSSVPQLDQRQEQLHSCSKDGVLLGVPPPTGTRDTSALVYP